MTFTSKLDDLMDKRKINKSILSKESGIPYTTIDGFYKKGTDNIKLSTLRKLAEYFNCSLDYLVDDEIEESSRPVTIAAHLDSDTLTQDELDDVARYIEFIKNKRK